MSRCVRVAVVGAAGYAGGELVRLLAGHPSVEIASVHARGRDGVPVADELPNLAPLGLAFTEDEPGADYLFTELTESTRAYGLSGHRHRPEIEQGLAEVGAAMPVTFVPHLVPQSRGILATCYLSLRDDLDDEAIASVLREAYDHEPFVHVSDAPPATKQAAGSNHAFVHGRRVAPRRAVVVSVIDNLGKGAAGQAIQNMNVALGLDETAGLGSLGIHP